MQLVPEHATTPHRRPLSRRAQIGFGWRVCLSLKRRRGRRGGSGGLVEEIEGKEEEGGEKRVKNNSRKQKRNGRKSTGARENTRVECGSRQGGRLEAVVPPKEATNELSLSRVLCSVGGTTAFRLCN